VDLDYLNNIAIGNKITVKGYNNVCIGNTFQTNGQDSIILGNNIGDMTTQGKVYKSIIIGTASLRQSVVKNLICIGVNNLNNLLLEDSLKVATFLGQNPVVIGNNISSSMLDYHLNIDNTFMKATSVNANGVNESQIYLGNNKEVVCIGFTSNANVTPDCSLYVNGKIKMTGAIDAAYVSCPSMMLGTSPSMTIPLGYVVASTGVYDVSTGYPIIRAGVSTLSKPDSGVIGISGAQNSSGYTVIYIAGACGVWCNTAVTSGSYLQASTTAGVVSASTSSVKTNFIIAKAITNWDPLNAALYPWIVTQTINNTLCGLIQCLVAT
jgi:hypothetical protein